METKDNHEIDDSKLKNNSHKRIIRIIALVFMVFMLWLVGIGDLINDNINNADANNEINHKCEIINDCIERRICGGEYICMNKNYKQICLAPISPIRSYLSSINEDYAAPFPICGCSNNKKCEYLPPNNPSAMR